MRTFEQEQIAKGQYFSRDNLIGALLAGPVLAMLTQRLREGSSDAGHGFAWTMGATWLVAFAFLGLGAARERLGPTLASRWQAAVDRLNASGPVRDIATCAPGAAHLRGRVVAVDLMMGPGGDPCVASFGRQQRTRTSTMRGEEGVTQFAREVVVERTSFVPFVVEDETGRIRVDAERLQLIEPNPTREVGVVLQRGDIIEVAGSVSTNEAGERVMRGDVIVQLAQPRSSGTVPQT